MEPDHGKAPLGRLRDVSIGGVETGCPRWRWAICQDLLDGIVARATSKLNEANSGNLTERKIGKLRFEIDNQLTHGYWQGAMRIVPLGLRGSEETDHASFIEVISRTAQAPFWERGLLGTFCWSSSIEDNGTNTLIEALFRPSTPLLDQFPIVSPFPSLPFRFWHLFLPSSSYSNPASRARIAAWVRSATWSFERILPI